MVEPGTDQSISFPIGTLVDLSEISEFAYYINNTLRIKPNVKNQGRY